MFSFVDSADGEAAATKIQSGWRRTRQRGREFGPRAVAAVRYVQALWRVSRILFPGERGRWILKTKSCVLGWCLRRKARTRCQGGTNLAGDDEFAEQAARAEAVLQWWGLYVDVLRRVQSGVSPGVLHGFCGGGGATEGTRRAGGASYGADLRPMPDYVRRFGETSFECGDCTDWAFMDKLRRRWGVRFAMCSPPCKYYSTARRRDLAATDG